MHHNNFVLLCAFTCRLASKLINEMVVLVF